MVRISFIINLKLNIMLIKEAVYKEIQVKQKRLVEDAVYGCDYCEKEIQQYPNEDNRLELTLFQKNDENIHLQFCSWDCVLKYIANLKTEFEFISLPFVYCSNVKESMRGFQRLVELIKERS